MKDTHTEETEEGRFPNELWSTEKNLLGRKEMGP